MHWLITGASGLLGHDLCGHLAGRGHRVTAVYNEHAPEMAGVEAQRIDLADTAPLVALIGHLRPDIVLHAAGITNVDACEDDEEKALHLHAHVARDMAQAAHACGSRMVLISTDHLWDGAKAFVTETEDVKPINAYARTKAAAERLTLEVDADALVLRTNFFGEGRPWRKGLTDWLISEFSQGRRVRAFSDVYFTPLAVNLFSRVIERLGADAARGVYHAAGGERVSKYEFALALADRLGFDAGLVVRSSIDEVELSAARPRDMSLSTEKLAAALGRPMPSLEESLSHQFPDRNNPTSRTEYSI